MSASSLNQSRKDAVKVLRGLSMVMEHYNIENGGQFKEKLSRTQHHASELFNLMVELYSHQSSASEKSHSNYTSSQAKYEDTHAHTHTQATAYNNRVPQSEIRNIDAIVKEELANAESSQLNSATTESTLAELKLDNTDEKSFDQTTNGITVDGDINHSIAEQNLPPITATSSSLSPSVHAPATFVKTIPAAVVDPIGFSTLKASKQIPNSPADQSQPRDRSSYDSSSIATTHATSSKPKMRPQSVPATPLSRMIGFGGLAAGLLFGRAKESATDMIYGTSSHGMSADNANRLADSLSRMRGAALKLGQIMSLQDDSFMPPALAQALDRVRQSADYMPMAQLEGQMKSQLGPEWRSLFRQFDDVPIAAASIGQVHRAVLNDGTIVAVKVQYPGVAQSIQSDLNNLKTIISLANVLPKGLFIDQIIKVAGTELSAECDYEAEAIHQMRYRTLVMADPMLSQHLSVPRVYTQLSTKQVLISTFVLGDPIDKALALSQEIRNAIARAMLVVTIKELFEWRFIQSDPNFANFLYDHDSLTIHCIDFGAAREFSQEFVDGYIELVWAAANQDSDTVVKISKDLGFLSGDESAEMTAAHVQAGLLLGEPFRGYEPFDFAQSHITNRVSKHGETFMSQRIKAPPAETYALHRKLAGAFLLCIRLKAVIPCRDILEDVYNSYKRNKMV